MSKRMHIYAAAIDPLRKKFGIPAKAVAEKVGEILSHNGKLAYDNEQKGKEINDVKAAFAVSEASVAAMTAELATAREQISDLQDKLATAREQISDLQDKLAAPSAIEFMRFGPPPANGESLISAHHVDPAELLETTPVIRAWLLHAQEHKHLGAVYDGGNFVVVSVKPLGEQPPVPPSA